MTAILNQFKNKETDLNLVSSPDEQLFVPEAITWKDEEGFTLLHWASLRGCAELVLYLLQNGADPNVKGSNEQTPLMWAAIEQQLLVMHILVDYGAALNARDDINETVLLHACQHDRLFAVMWLISRGADVTAANTAQITAAHWSAFSGSYMMISLMDAFGLNLRTAFDKNGLLPIHRTLELEFWGTARMMVTFDPHLLNCKTNDGLNLIDFAQDRGLPTETFSKWLSLCTDARYQTQPKTADREDFDFGKDGTRLDKRLWAYILETLARDERLTMFAYVFAVCFVLAHMAYLWVVNESLMNFLGFTRIERWVINKILTALPLMGVFGVISFTAAYYLDPGYIKPNYLGLIRNSNIPESALAPMTESCVQNKPKGHEIDLEDKRGAELIERVRRNRRAVFEGITAYVVKPEALIMHSPSHKLAIGHRVREYAEGKGFERILRPHVEKTGEYRKVEEMLDMSRVCPTCWIRRGLRTKHCSVCDACCEIMDHHCDWISKCVGRRSHVVFMLFVICAYLSQVHQIVLLGVTLCLPVVQLLPSPYTPGQLLQIPLPSAWQWLLLFPAILVHVATHAWSSQLFRVQWKNMLEGYTTNESLNESRYKHFLVAARCDKEGLPLEPVDEPSATPPNFVIAEGATAPLRPKFKKGGDCKNEVTPQEPASSSETAPPSSEENHSPTKTAILESVVKKSPVITAGESSVTEVLHVRRFLRNPFSANKTRVENCIEFWTNSRPTEIEYDDLRDVDFVLKMRKEIEMRRCKLRAGTKSPSKC